MEQYQKVCRITRPVPNDTCTFLDFVCGFDSYVKGQPKTKQCKSVSFCFTLGICALNFLAKRPKDLNVNPNNFDSFWGEGGGGE